MAYEVVLWAIVLMFIVTFIVTVLGLIKKIQIEDKYLGVLFTACILEILSCAFLIFKNGPPIGLTPEQEYFRLASEYFQKAEHSRVDKDDASAERHLRSILRIHVKDLPLDVKTVYKSLGDLYFQREDWLGASHALAIYYEIDPSDFASALQYGQALQKRSLYEDSLPIFEHLATGGGSNAEVYYGLINIHRRRGSFHKFAQMEDLAQRDFEKALDYAERVLSITASDKKSDAYAKSLRTQAAIHWEMGNTLVAFQRLSDISKEFPQNIGVREDRAAVRLELAKQTGDASEIAAARDSFAELYQADPRGPSSTFNAAGFAEAAALSTNTPPDIMESAKGAALDAIGRAPANPYNRYAAAVVMYAIHQQQKAMEFLAQAIRLERGRALNPYTFDYERLKGYETLAKSWGEKP